MGESITIKHTKELMIDKEYNVKFIVDEKGHVYLPYYDLLKGLFKENYMDIAKKLKPILINHFTIVKSKIYIPIHDLREVFQYIDNDNKIKTNLIHQLFSVKKPKLDEVEKTDITVKALKNLKGTCSKLFQEINEFDCKQCDLIHVIENETDDKKMAEHSKNLRELRKQRRKAKDKYRLLNYVNEYFENKKIDAGSFSNLEKRFTEIKNEIESAEIIYFNRSKENDNKTEMENKILALKEHYK